MRLSDDVVLFNYAGIPMAGCLSTGAIIGLTPRGLSLCRQLQNADLSPAEIDDKDQVLIEHLSKGGFLDAPTPPRLQSAYLHITQRCNLECAGCYSFSKERNSAIDASAAQWKTAIKGISDAGAQKYIISGGEPFLRTDLHEITKYIKKVSPESEIIILSNGTLASYDNLLKIAPYTDCVSISFDGWSDKSEAAIRKTQRYSQLVAVVKHINEIGMRAHIIPTIHAKNYRDIPHYVELAERLGASLNFSLLTCASDDPAVSCLVPSDSELSDISNFLFRLNNNPSTTFAETPIGATLRARRNCGAGQKSISIASDGTIYPCHMLHLKAFGMGNAFVDNVSEVLSSCSKSHISQFGPDDNKECSICEYKYLCGGGCRARSVIAHNNAADRDPYCALMKSFYQCAEEDLKRALK